MRSMFRSSSRAGARSFRVLPVLFAAALVVGLGFGAGAARQSRAPEGDSGVRATFSQLNWRGADGKVHVPNSRVGAVDLTLTESAAELLVGRGGFVNVVTSPDGGVEQWSVRNLYLVYGSVDAMLKSSPSVQFDLTTPNGLRVESLKYSLTVTPDPLREPLAGAPRLAAAVALEGYLTGGRDGGSELSKIPFIIGPWIGPDFFDGAIERTAATSVPPDSLPAVDEGENGCAPGAVARSIKYMLDNAGVECDDVQDIYDDLYEGMGTTPEDGTYDENLKKGKDAYNEKNGLGIDTEIVYLDSDGGRHAADLAGRIGRVARLRLLPRAVDGGIDLSGVMDALDAGGDVEILISWDEGGGHVAMVTSVTCLSNGQYQITYVDDPNQGDGMAENEEHTITVNSDGSFDGGQVDGFVIETMK